MAKKHQRASKAEAEDFSSNIPSATERLVLERKQRRREVAKRHYEKNAEIIRENSGNKWLISDKRTGIKAKRWRAEVARRAVAAAEVDLQRVDAVLALQCVDAVLALHAMLHLKAARREFSLPPSSNEEEDEDIDHMARDASMDLEGGYSVQVRPVGAGASDSEGDLENEGSDGAEEVTWPAPDMSGHQDNRRPPTITSSIGYATVQQSATRGIRGKNPELLRQALGGGGEVAYFDVLNWSDKMAPGGLVNFDEKKKETSWSELIAQAQLQRLQTRTERLRLDEQLSYSALGHLNPLLHAKVDTGSNSGGIGATGVSGGGDGGGGIGSAGRTMVVVVKEQGLVATGLLAVELVRNTACQGHCFVTARRLVVLVRDGHGYGFGYKSVNPDPNPENRTRTRGFTDCSRVV
ncbi:hypothetical protein FB451DRAFT_1183317 [Mycena latifolia]|nr:hypothetical protein FB451DRAFT_1183317 [Mycena latifolia]